jgi:hypothetical protein
MNSDSQIMLCLHVDARKLAAVVPFRDWIVRRPNAGLRRIVDSLVGTAHVRPVWGMPQWRLRRRLRFRRRKLLICRLPLQDNAQLNAAGMPSNSVPVVAMIWTTCAA